MLPANAYITIQSFMRTQLNLSGTDLLIYAIIHGFSQDGKTWFRGTLSYLIEWTGDSRSTVMRSLKRLVDDGYILREDMVENSVTYPRYKVVNESLRGGCQNDTPRTQNDTGGVSKCNGGGVKLNTLYTKDANIGLK